MTFDAHEFINDTRREIAVLRRKSSSLKRAVNITAAVVVVIVVTAFLQAILITIYGVALRYHSDLWENNAKDVWAFFAHYTGPLWSFEGALPLPKTVPSNDNWAPWALTLFFYLCIMLFCASLNTRSRRLKETASEAEKNLNLQAPLLMQMNAFAAAHGTAQSASVGNG